MLSLLHFLLLNLILILYNDLNGFKYFALKPEGPGIDPRVQGSGCFLGGLSI